MVWPRVNRPIQRRGCSREACWTSRKKIPRNVFLKVLIDNFCNFYRTHVHMGSDHWVALSLTPYGSFLKPCEDLVKTVNVVNVVKI